jgi:hypothetical protein
MCFSIPAVFLLSASVSASTAANENRIWNEQEGTLQAKEDCISASASISNSDSEEEDSNSISASVSIFASNSNSEEYDGGGVHLLDSYEDSISDSANGMELTATATKATSVVYTPTLSRTLTRKM